MAWMQMSFAGDNACPSGRECHTMAAVGTQVVVFGGNDENNRFNDVNILDTETMTWAAYPSAPAGAAAPCKRSAHVGCIVDGQWLYVHGGWNGLTELGDLHRWNIFTKTWEKLTTTGDAPSARHFHVGFPLGRYLYVFGGYDGTAWRNDCYCLNLDTNVWVKVHDLAPAAATYQPRSRASATATVIAPNKAVVFGGYDGTEFLSDMWIATATESPNGASPPSIQWQSVDAASKASMVYHRTAWPTARSGHAAEYVGGLFMVIGGRHKDGRFNDVWAFDMAALTWKQWTTAGEAFKRRKTHATARFGSRILLFGGHDGETPGWRSDFHVLDVAPLLRGTRHAPVIVVPPSTYLRDMTRLLNLPALFAQALATVGSKAANSSSGASGAAAGTSSGRPSLTAAPASGSGTAGGAAAQQAAAAQTGDAFHPIEIDLDDVEGATPGESGGPLALASPDLRLLAAAAGVDPTGGAPATAALVAAAAAQEPSMPSRLNTFAVPPAFLENAASAGVANQLRATAAASRVVAANNGGGNPFGLAVPPALTQAGTYAGGAAPGVSLFDSFGMPLTRGGGAVTVGLGRETTHEGGGAAGPAPRYGGGYLARPQPRLGPGGPFTQAVGSFLALGDASSFGVGSMAPGIDLGSANPHAQLEGERLARLRAMAASSAVGLYLPPTSASNNGAAVAATSTAARSSGVSAAAVVPAVPRGIFPEQTAAEAAAAAASAAAASAASASPAGQPEEHYVSSSSSSSSASSASEAQAAPPSSLAAGPLGPGTVFDMDGALGHGGGAFLDWEPDEMLVAPDYREHRITAGIAAADSSRFSMMTSLKAAQLALPAAAAAVAASLGPGGARAAAAALPTVVGALLPAPGSVPVVPASALGMEATAGPTAAAAGGDAGESSSLAVSAASSGSSGSLAAAARTASDLGSGAAAAASALVAAAVAASTALVPAAAAPLPSAAPSSSSSALAAPLGPPLGTPASAFSDVVFLVQGTPIRAHRGILAARCEYFAAMLCGDFAEAFAGAGSVANPIPLPDMSLPVFVAVLRYIYTDALPLGPDWDELVVPVLAAADRLGLLRLSRLCQRYIESCLSLDNAFDVLKLAQELPAPPLREAALRFIASRWGQLRSHFEAVDRLPPGTLQELMQRSALYDAIREEEAARVAAMERASKPERPARAGGAAAAAAAAPRAAAAAAQAAPAAPVVAQPAPVAAAPRVVVQLGRGAAQPAPQPAAAAAVAPQPPAAAAAQPAAAPAAQPAAAAAASAGARAAAAAAALVAAANASAAERGAAVRAAAASGVAAAAAASEASRNLLAAALRVDLGGQGAGADDLLEFETAAGRSTAIRLANWAARIEAAAAASGAAASSSSSSSAAAAAAPAAPATVAGSGLGGGRRSGASAARAPSPPVNRQLMPALSAVEVVSHSSPEGEGTGRAAGRRRGRTAAAAAAAAEVEAEAAEAAAAARPAKRARLGGSAAAAAAPAPAPAPAPAAGRGAAAATSSSSSSSSAAPDNAPATGEGAPPAGRRSRRG